MIKKTFSLFAVMAALSVPVLAETTQKDITVYRSSSCGCCKKWVQHLKDHQFNVTDIVTDDMSVVKAELGIPKPLQSCHTAVVNGYKVEGHVPASDIKKMLTKKTDIAGISVPGMPAGTPGMEMGDRKDPYQVISYDKQGQFAVFNQHNLSK
jgi:hypothetical protein